MQGLRIKKIRKSLNSLIPKFDQYSNIPSFHFSRNHIFHRVSSEKRQTMIIDCHTHIFPDEVRKDRQAYCKRDQGVSSIYEDSKARMAGVEDLIASMDEYGIERSVICGFPWGEPDLCSLHNRYLME